MSNWINCVQCNAEVNELDAWGSEEVVGLFCSKECLEKYQYEQREKEKGKADE